MTTTPTRLALMALISGTTTVYTAVVKTVLRKINVYSASFTAGSVVTLYLNTIAFAACETTTPVSGPPNNSTESPLTVFSAAFYVDQVMEIGDILTVNSPQIGSVLLSGTVIT